MDKVYCKFRLLLAVSLLGFVVGAIYLLAILPGAFLSDDFSFLSYITQWDREGRLLSNLWGDFSSSMIYSAGNFYRPLVMTSYVIDFRLWHINASGWHLTNLTLHLLNVLLLWAFVQRLVGGTPGEVLTLTGGMAATFFALHPLAPEVVVWISGRGDSMALAGMLLALYAYLRAQGVWGRWYFLAILSFLFALGSKEAAITLPGALVVLHLVGAVPPSLHFKREHSSIWLRQVAKGIGPFVLLLLLYFTWRWVIFDSVFQVYPEPGSLAIRSPEWWATKMAALRFFLTPSFQPSGHVTLTRLVIILQLLLGLAVATRSSSARKLWLFGMMWLAVTLLPSVPYLYIAPTGEGARLLYIPSAALAVALVALLAALPAVRLGKPAWQQMPVILGFTGLAFVIPSLVILLPQRLCPWAKASENMRVLPGAIAAQTVDVPTGRTRILIIPDHIGGALFGRNAQGALMTPPIQQESLHGSVLVRTAQSACQPSVEPTAITVHDYRCWNVHTKQFDPVDSTSYSPEAWQDHWRLNACE